MARLQKSPKKDGPQVTVHELCVTPPRTNSPANSSASLSPWAKLTGNLTKQRVSSKSSTYSKPRSPLSHRSPLSRSPVSRMSPISPTPRPLQDEHHFSERIYFPPMHVPKPPIASGMLAVPSVEDSDLQLMHAKVKELMGIPTSLLPSPVEYGMQVSVRQVVLLVILLTRWSRLFRARQAHLNWIEREEISLGLSLSQLQLLIQDSARLPTSCGSYSKQESLGVSERSHGPSRVKKGRLVDERIHWRIVPKVVAIKEYKLCVPHPLNANLFSELQIFRRAKHPNLITLFDTVWERGNDTILLVLHYMDAGTLGELIQSRKNRRVTLEEKVVAGIAYEVAKGLSYLHSQDVIHHDIRPSTILLSTHGAVKISHFGHATFSAGKSSTRFTKRSIVNPLLAAPELARSSRRPSGGSYTNKIDVWALGLTTVCMLGEKLPMAHMMDADEILQQIARYGTSEWISEGRATLSGMSSKARRRMSRELKDFICACLHIDAMERGAVGELICMPWLAEERRCGREDFVEVFMAQGAVLGNRAGTKPTEPEKDKFRVQIHAAENPPEVDESSIDIVLKEARQEYEEAERKLRLLEANHDSVVRMVKY